MQKHAPSIHLKHQPTKTRVKKELPYIVISRKKFFCLSVEEIEATWDQRFAFHCKSVTLLTEMLTCCITLKWETRTCWAPPSRDKKVIFTTDHSEPIFYSNLKVASSVWKTLLNTQRFWREIISPAVDLKVIHFLLKRQVLWCRKWDQDDL